MLKVLSLCDQERAKPPSVKVSVLTFLVNNEALRGVQCFENTRKKKSQGLEDVLQCISHKALTLSI